MNSFITRNCLTFLEHSHRTTPLSISTVYSLWPMVVKVMIMIIALWFSISALHILYYMDPTIITIIDVIMSKHIIILPLAVM